MIMITSPFIPGSGNPDTAYESVANGAAAYAPGDLGKAFPWGEKIYRKVQLDVGASPTEVGQILYWKDRDACLVTNKAADALLPGAPPAPPPLTAKATPPHERMKEHEAKKDEPKKDTKDTKATATPKEDEPVPVPDSNRNNVAGVARGVVPPGSQFFVLVFGTGVQVKEAGGAIGGMKLVANAGDMADALGIAVGTASPFKEIGMARAATVDGVCLADVNMAE